MKEFEHLKVIELASVLAGPLCGSFFAELGAKVVKVENKTTNGDITRSWKLPFEDEQLPFGSYYAAANFGKQILMLNLNDENDRQLLLAEIKSADVIISNYKPATAQKYMLDYHSLKKINEGLIYAQLNGFEAESNRGAYDAVLQAEAGLMYINGEKENPPIKIPFAIVDVLSNHQLREAILVALYKKAQTGKGAYIKVSMLKAAVSDLINQASNFLMNGEIPQRIGSEHPAIAPYGDVFSTKDYQYIVLAVGTDKQFEALCGILELEHHVNDIKYRANQNRVINREALVKILKDKISTMLAKDLMQKFDSSNVPAGLVKNMQQVFDHPLAQTMVKMEKIEEQDTKRVSTIAFNLE